MEYLVVVAGDDERIRRVRARSAEEAMQTVKKALGLAPGTDLRFITNRQIRHEALSLDPPPRFFVRFS